MQPGNRTPVSDHSIANGVPPAAQHWTEAATPSRLVIVTMKEAEMAKGQQRSSKEKRKPKKEKSAKSAPSAGAIGSGGKK